jgi:hypothetical protein
MWHAWEKSGKCTRLWLESLKERDQLEDRHRWEDGTVKPMPIGIPWDDNLFLLWASFCLIQVFSNWCNLTYLLCH